MTIAMSLLANFFWRPFMGSTRVAFLPLAGIGATFATTFLAIALPASHARGGESDAKHIEFFETKIRPVLVEHCYECHSTDAKKVQGELLLDSKAGIARGGESGPVIDIEAPEESALLSAMRYENFEMPPKGKLPDSIVNEFAHWIKIGAPDPRDDSVAEKEKASINIEAARQAWEYQTPTRKRLPEVDAKNWARNRIDYFILSKLEEHQLRPSAEANRQVLIRRMTFDLLGLPPTFEEVQAFESDRTPTAHRSLVERLLASPRFGERWTRMWLDIARYAEDQAHIVGDDKSLFYPNAYLYRNWVIDALNHDLAYDRFIQLQLAADLIPETNSDQQVALGFLGLGPKYYNRGRLEVKADEWEDRVDTVSRGLLGLTVACARCHDHKYDPISTQDYYAMAGVFASTQMHNLELDVANDIPNSTKDELANGEDKGPKKKDATKKKKAGQAKEPGQAVHIVREGEPTDLHVFIRGDVNRKGPLTKRRFPAVLCSSDARDFANGSGRLELAEAIASSQNPLTARVLVNRVVGQLLGRAIVKTTSNFGKLGSRPTHPDLLDDLAVRFMENDWSIKLLVREIVSSATYRQASLASSNQVAADPTNQWFGRMNRKRLSVEAWRDSILAGCGQLAGELGGPSIEVHDPTERRRTVYSQVSRFQLNPMLQMFDFPDANVHAASRSETTTAVQKLFVLNNQFMVHQAASLSQALASAHPDNDEARICAAYQRLFARMPTEDELHLGRAFVASPDGAGDSSEGDENRLWQQYVHALLSSNEMLFID